MNLENIEDIYELSPAQQGMLFQSLASRKPGLYFEQFACALHGNLDLEAFRRAWGQTLARHTALRSSFHVEELDKPLQIVHQRVELPWEHLDWRDLSADEQNERLDALMQAEQERGFELAQAPLMRLILIRTADDAYRFVWNHHHLLVDGWSLPIVIQEVFAAYQSIRKGEPLRLPPARPYRDYIGWLQDQDEAQTEHFWRDMLRGFTAPTSLMRWQAAGSSTADEESFGEQQIELQAETTAALQSFAQQHRITQNTLLQGAWAMLLSRYSGEDDVIFGITVSGRPAEMIGVESMVGLFINTLPMRVRMSPEDLLLPWLQRLQAQLLELRSYEHTPLGQIQEWSDAPRGLPLFESIMVFENYPLDPALLERGQSLKVSQAHVVGGKTTYPLTIMVEPGPRMVIKIIYDARRYHPSTISLILTRFQEMLGDLIAGEVRKLADLPLLQKQTLTISSTFEAAPVKEFLDFWMQALDVPSRIEFAPVGQFLPEHDSLASEKQNGIDVRLLRLEDMRGMAGAENAQSSLDPKMIERHVRECVSVLKVAALESATPSVICLCPASPDVSADAHDRLFLEEMERLIVSELTGVRGASLVTPSDLKAAYPVSSYYGSEKDERGRASFTDAFFCALGTLIARRINAIQSLPYKVIVLDEETLWHGQNREDGSLGIEVDPLQRAIQEFMIRQHEAGRLICLCSENNERDVIEVFERSAKVTLSRNHLAAWRINRRPKSENLKSLAEEMRVDPCRFIFLDSDSIECAEVRANCPEVLTLHLPREMDAAFQFLEHVWAFDLLRPSIDSETATRSAARAPSTAERIAKSILLNHIATELNDVDSILRVARSRKVTRQKSEKDFIAPRTPIEKGLARIWSDFLGIEQIGIYDNFFDLGGHSLLATQIISRVRESFQVEVPLKLLFTRAFTVAELSKAIEQHLIEQGEAEEIADALSELNSLSDEEIRQLLASEYSEQTEVSH